MLLDPRLLAIVVCPVDKGALYPLGETDDGQRPAFLYNPRLRRQYLVVDGVPNLLPDDAVEVDEATHAALQAEIDAGGVVPTGSVAPADGSPADLAADTQ